MDDDSDNGLYFNTQFIPEEILIQILSFVEPKQLLKCSQVCRKWNSIIKSHAVWYTIYNRKYNHKAKNLPWYVYYCLFATDIFDTNLLKNGNGQNSYENWQINKDYGDRFKIEDPPVGADALPLNVDDFCGKTSCFSTSYYECNKEQTIFLNRSPVLLSILNNFKPHIYCSEWVAGRFDCGCVYTLTCRLIRDDAEETVLKEQVLKHRISQWNGSKWEKIQMVLKNYPENIKCLIFEHEGQDTQFWKGNYGSKMAGGVVKILFDSIEPLEDDEILEENASEDVAFDL